MFGLVGFVVKTGREVFLGVGFDGKTLCLFGATLWKLLMLSGFGKGREGVVFWGMGAPTLGWRLKDVGDGFFIAGHGFAVGADFVGVGAVDGVGDEAVFFGVGDCGEALPEAVELIGFEVAFEDGVLGAGTVVFAGVGYFFEAFWVGDVVGDDGEHAFFSWRVAVKLAGRGDIREGGFPPVGLGGGHG